MNLDGLCAWSIPTDGGLAYVGVARDRNRIRTGGQGRRDECTWSVDRCKTDVPLERIRAISRHVQNISATAGSVIDGDLHRRVADDQVSTEDVSLNSLCQKDPIRISDDCIVLDYVPGVRGNDKANSKVG